MSMYFIIFIDKKTEMIKKKEEKIEKLSERTARAPSLARRGQYELR